MAGISHFSAHGFKKSNGNKPTNDEQGTHHIVKQKVSVFIYYRQEKQREERIENKGPSIKVPALLSLFTHERGLVGSVFELQTSLWPERELGKHYSGHQKLLGCLLRLCSNRFKGCDHQKTRNEKAEKRADSHSPKRLSKYLGGTALLPRRRMRKTVMNTSPFGRPE